jgi:hypothetical protein
MGQSKKSTPLRSHQIGRRSTTKRAKVVTSERTKEVDRILADADVDKRSREVFAKAAADYAPLMKRLADK